MMPKRVIDGESLWTSDKLAEVRIEWRAEYANLLPLSLANGVFECDPAKVYRAVYAYNRPDKTREDVAAILTEFERAKMLFRWREPDGKWWGHFNGVDKPGRLPADSRKDREKLGPEVPIEKLRAFLDNVTCGYPDGSRSISEGYPGKGNGSGFGSGSGSGSCIGQGYEDNLETETPYPAPNNGAYLDDPLTRPTTNRLASPKKILCFVEEPAENLTTRIHRMLDAYPRACPDDKTRQEWALIFEDNIAALTREFFRGDSDNATKFVETSLKKFSAKQKDPKYAWGPAKFFEMWVREEHDLNRLKKKQQQEFVPDALAQEDFGSGENFVAGDNEREAEDEEEEDFG